jgi:hypothetical protein
MKIMVENINLFCVFSLTGVIDNQIGIHSVSGAATGQKLYLSKRK